MSTPERRTPDLSGGDYAFLGFVAWGMQTAYQIKQAMSQSVSFFWSAVHSQVYQQAARLSRDGYVREREERTGRRRRILSLTPKGRRALRTWLTTPAEPLQLRDEMLVKVFFAHIAGDRGATRAILEEQRTLYAGVIEEFRGIESQLAGDEDDRSRDPLLTVRLGVRVMQAYLDWLDETIPMVEKDEGT